MSEVKEKGFALKGLWKGDLFKIKGAKNIWGDRSGNPSFLRIIV